MTISGFLTKASEFRFRHKFYAHHDFALEQQMSPSQALQWAMSIFAKQQPFSVLDPLDIESIATQFAPFLNRRKLVADLFWEAKYHRTAHPLKNPAFIREAVASLEAGGEPIEMQET